ncbi:MAG: glycogen debranching enzyme family protein [bacterium]|nr:glycogen debranching enzyme family protein [bacterium]
MTPIDPRPHAIVRRVAWARGDAPELLATREWLVTNGLGGYASGTLGGVATRRYHGLLVAALPAPIGRMLAVAGLAETLCVGEDAPLRLGGEAPFVGPMHLPTDALEEVALEDGLPVWRFAHAGTVLERRIVMPHLRNTALCGWTLLAAPGPVRLDLRPELNLRLHDRPVDGLAGRYPGARFEAPHFPYGVGEHGSGIEVRAVDLPPVRLGAYGPRPVRFLPAEACVERLYAVERERGYESCGPVVSPGHWEAVLAPGDVVTVVASMQPWDEMEALGWEEARAAEAARRRELVGRAHPALRTGVGAELALAADHFVVTPHARLADEALQHAEGHEARSVVAGYHWFTDWGRDTMIALEGLTLRAGSPADAASILRTFAHHLRDGLIPNYFPEGESEGVYHTADATLWFVHALGRQAALTGDPTLRRELMPAIQEIVDRHVAGTRFGIGIDPADGLLRQGAEGYQLTWMDAKVEGWVVTPRRGKAVEINALWYNALRLVADWAAEDGHAATARRLLHLAEVARESFNARFWWGAGGYCHDVVDVDGVVGAVDSSLRPNQLLAIALPYPVLAPERWRPVVEQARDHLLTPVGLRTLAPGHPDYRPTYCGDLRNRDAAYHQGTVWAWLLGPFADAWLRVHPGDTATVRDLVEAATTSALSEACTGEVSEIFDAEAPYYPRGCIAQAWSVAELVRCTIAGAEDGRP